MVRISKEAQFVCDVFGLDPSEFAEARASAKRKPDPPDEPMTQGVLFAGLDCLPGQGDLFPTDGEATDGEAQ